MTENEKDVLEEAPVNTEENADEAVDENADDGFEWKEAPVFEVEHKEDCLCEVKVTIPVANIKAALDDVYEEVNDGVQVPGFRRGKAPRKLLEKRLGKYARSTVAERLADRIGIIQGGKLLAEGTLTELRSRAGGDNATLEDVYLQLVGASAA